MKEKKTISIEKLIKTSRNFERILTGGVVLMVPFVLIFLIYYKIPLVPSLVMSTLLIAWLIVGFTPMIFIRKYRIHLEELKNELMHPDENKT